MDKLFSFLFPLLSDFLWVFEEDDERGTFGNRFLSLAFLPHWPPPRRHLFSNTGGSEVRRKDSFVLHYVGGEALLVPTGSQVVDMNCIVTLNKTGRYIWDLLSKDCSLEELTAALAQHFAVDTDRARADIQNFLAEIIIMGLIEG